MKLYLHPLESITAIKATGALAQLVEQRTENPCVPGSIPGGTTLQELITQNVTFETFFQRASLNPNAHLITGLICGYRIEEIDNPLTQQVRYLDKLVDELAKGRKMDKIMRTA
jgi:hypothetical protein